MRIDELQNQLLQTEEYTIKNSTFIALAAKVHSIQEVKDLYIATAQRFPSADHIMAAYALKEKGILKSGAVDDKEYGAASKIKNAIFETKTKNTVVFVVRFYGGIHMGFERFGAILHVTKDILRKIAEL